MSRIDPAGEVRAVTTVAELKALADPLRLAIIYALTRDAPRELRVLSVKELAAELGEPKTKLYRHIKQLESAGLIRVAATRMVSGILEQRYQACQGDLTLSPDAMREPYSADDANAVVAVALDRFRGRYLAYLAGLAKAGGPSAQERPSMLTVASRRVSPARAEQIRDRLKEVMAEIDQAGDDSPDAVPVEVIIGFMSPG